VLKINFGIIRLVEIRVPPLAGFVPRRFRFRTASAVGYVMSPLRDFLWDWIGLGLLLKLRNYLFASGWLRVQSAGGNSTGQNG